MRRILKFLLLFIAAFCINSKAFSQYQLPLKNSFSLGPLGAVAVVYDDDLSYYSNNHVRANYGVNGEYVHYFKPFVGVGVDYTYMKSRKSSNKMSTNIVGPSLTLRYLNSPYTSLSVSIGISYMNYNEDVFYDNRYTSLHKNYATANTTLAYCFHLGKNASGMVKFQMITADWFVNPEYHWHDNYDELFLDNNITYFTLGFSIMIGK